MSTTSTSTAASNGKPKTPPTPRHDPDQTLAFVEALEINFDVECVEVRILKGNLDRSGFIVKDPKWQFQYTGYYDRTDSLLVDAGRLKGIAGYVSVNPLSPDLLARSDNALIRAEYAAADDDVICLRWWYVDFDSRRRKGISATDAELAKAIGRRDQFLADHPELAAAAHFGCSGNGAWCVVRLNNLPNDEHHRELIVRATAVLAAKYTDDAVEVDTSTTNAGRVMPLVGSAKCKGSNRPERPWRLATIDSTAGRREPIDLAAWLERNEPARPEEPAKDDARDIPTGPREAVPGRGDEGKPRVYHDRDAVAAALVGQHEKIAREWGLKLTGKAKGDWLKCHAIDRKDSTPSAGLNSKNGTYHDFKGPTDIGFFDLAVKLGAYPDWQSAVNGLGERLGLVAPRDDSHETNGKTTAKLSRNGTGHHPEDDLPALAPGTEIMAYDVDPPNKGSVVRDPGTGGPNRRVTTYFKSPAGYEATVGISRNLLEPIGGPSEGGFVGFVGDSPQECPKFEGAPGSLAADLLPVPPLPPALIPEPLRQWVADIARRGCFPIEYPVAALIVSLSILIGRGLAIRPRRRDAWTCVPNTWGAIIGPPGLQKTPAVEEVLLPFRRLVAEAMEAHTEARRRALEDTALAEAKAAGAKKRLSEAAKKGADDSILRQLVAEANAEPSDAEPIAKRYLVNDTTVEKLGELLRENPRGLLYFRDELTGFFRSMDRQGHESDRSFYLESWPGTGSFTFDRIGRGTVHIPAICLSIFGTIQPGPLARYLKGAASGEDADGFVPRFQMLLYPDAPAKFVNVDEWPDADAKGRAFEVFRWIDNLDAAALGAERDEDRGLHFLRFDDRAQALFDEWRGDLEGRLRGGAESALLTNHLAKYRSLMPSLALLFHVVASVGCERLEPVTHEAAEMAAAWCELLEAHAHRVYQSAIEGDPESASRLAERIKQSLPNPFTYRQVAVKGWAGLDNVEDVRKAVGILEDRNWAKVVVRQPGSKGGRTSEEVWINPAVRGDAVEAPNESP